MTRKGGFRRFRWVPSGLLIPALILGAGCVEGGSPPEMRVETTASGIPWVHNTGAGSWEEGEEWTLTEGLRVGTVEGESAQQFGRIWAFVPVGDSLAVLDGQAQEVRLFDPTARHLRTIGRPGEGPGEFRRAEGVTVDDRGHLWVLDGRGGRIHEFTLAGEALRSLPHIPGGTSGLTGETRIGTSVLEWIFDSPNRDYTTGFLGSQARYRPVLIDTATHVADTLPEVVVEYRMSGTNRVPLTASFQLTGGTDPEEFWFTHPTEYTVHRRSLHGDTILILSLDDAVPASVSGQEADSVARGDPMLRAAVPDQFPAIDHIMTDRAGHLLVFPHLEGVPRLKFMDVFLEASGEYLGRVELPFAMQRRSPAPRAGPGALYLSDVGPFDVDQVVRLDVKRPESGERR